MGDEALHDLTPAYALDALDDAERREYETHLAHCEQCRRELASLSDTASSLAYAADAPPPPSHLRSRILAAARSARPNVVPLRPRWALPAAAAAAVAVAAACSVGGLYLSYYAATAGGASVAGLLVLVYLGVTVARRYVW
jgi:anti-sigma factor RsiW